MRLITFATALCVCAFPAWGQQAPIVQEGPYNAASYVPMGLPSGGIAQGSMFILKGGALGACGTVIASSFPLQGSMAGLQIRVTVAGTTINARMIYVVACRQNSPDQVAAILPSNVPVGTGTLQVITTLGGVTRTSPTVPIRVVANSFGMFTRNQNGNGPAIVQNFISATNTPTNGLLESAQVGQTEILWGTGLGAVDVSNEINGPVPGDLPLNVEVYVGGKKATVTYRGRSGCCAGIDQIVFTVPAGLDGCYVSVMVRVNGVTSVAGTMSVAGGKVCAEPTRMSASDLVKIQKAGTIGVADISVNRTRVNLNIPGMGAIQGDLDNGAGQLRKYGSTAEVMASLSGSLAGYHGSASPGSCVVLSYPLGSSDDAFTAATPDVPDSVGSNLDAGAALRLNGVKGLKLISKQLANDGSIDGYYLPGEVFLGGGLAALGIPVTPLYLEPGSLSVDNGAGTAQVGAFTSSLVIPANPATWTSQTPGGNLSLAQDLTVTWSGGNAGELVAVSGSSARRDVAGGAQFICVERATAGTLTVPAWVLSALPASGPVDGVTAGFLSFIATNAQPSRFTATGIDLGYFNWGLIQLKNVVFQ